MARRIETMTAAIEAAGLPSQLRPPVYALAGLDLGIHEGEVHRFLGTNEAGKSTTIRTIFGLLRKSGAAISLLSRWPKCRVPSNLSD